MEDHLIDMPEGAACAQCGYSIHALTVDRCPECGTAFDRKQILDLLQGKPVKRPFDSKAAEMLAAPPWWTTGLVLFAIVICLASGPTRPSVNRDPPPLLSVAMFCIALGALLLRLIDRRKVPVRYDMADAPQRRFGINWIMLPGALVLFYSTAFADLHSRIAFELSRGQMNALAQRVGSSSAYTPDQRVGFYDAVQIYPTPDGMTFRIRGHTDAGFVFTTTGKSPKFRNDTVWWGGGWYAIPGE